MEVYPQTSEKERLETVKIGEMKVSTDRSVSLVSYALGSCIGVAVYDPVIPVGGMLHYLLPYPTSEERKKSSPLSYGSLALPAFFAELYRQGASKLRLIVKVAGGADMLGAAQGFRVGEMNWQLAEGFFREQGIKLKAKAVGGSKGRTLKLRIRDGKVSILSVLTGEVEL